MLGIYFATVVAVGYAIFSPFKDIAKRQRTAGSRFQLTDLLAIFLPLQAGLALVQYLDTRSPTKTIISVIVMLIASIAWFYGMRLLWRMDVRNWFKRIVFLGVVMPLGFVLSGSAVLIIFATNSLEEMVFRSLIVVTLVVGIRVLGIWVLGENPQRIPSVEEDARNGSSPAIENGQGDQHDNDDCN